MKKPLRQLAPLLAVQLLCVAVGLFMHHRFLVYVTSNSYQENVWRNLSHDANRVRKALEHDPQAFDQVESDSSPGLKEALDRLPPHAGGVVVVDRRWRVLATAGAPQNERPIPSVGASLRWKRQGGHEESATAVNRGVLTFGDLSYIAAAQPLGRGQATVVAFRAEDEVAAEAGALTRPVVALTGTAFLWIGALLAIVDYLALSRILDHANREKTQADNENLRRTQNLVRTRDAVIFGLAKLADSRDPETGDHLERISLYAEMLAAALHRDPRYAEVVTPSFVSAIRISSVLHDIGKVGIEDAILRKKGELNEEERTRMQTHTRIGGDCLREIERRLGSSNFLQMAREIALAHHERWDGSGYPKGLAEEQIPLPARIVALVDVYDALASRRCYKPAFDHKDCIGVIQRDSGRHFDPELVEVWLTIEPKFREIAMRYADRSPAVVGTNDKAAVKDLLPEEAHPADVREGLPPAAVSSE